MLSRYKSFQYIEQLPKLVGEKVTLRGWVVNKTEKGKLIFIILRDGTGIAQLVFQKIILNKQHLKVQNCLHRIINRN